MGTTRHKTIIDVDVNNRSAERAIAKMQRQFDDLQQSAGDVGGGGGAAGSSRPQSPGPGPGPGAAYGRDAPGGSGWGARMGRFAAQGTSTAFAGSLPGVFMGASRLGTGALGAGASALGRREGVVGSFGRGLGAAVPFVGALAAAGAAGLAYRMSLVEQKGQLQLQRSMARSLGVKAGSGAGLAMTPEEAAAASLQFGGAAGFQGAGTGLNTLAMSRRGISLQSMGALAGTRAAGMGGRGQSDAFIVSLARTAGREGLRGSKIDAYLQEVAAFVTQMGQQGLTVNVDNFGELVGRMQMAGVRGEGARLPRALGRVGRLGTGMRQQLLAPFGQMAETAVLARAMGRSRSLLDLTDQLGNMDITEKFGAVSGLGPEFAGGAFRYFGMSGRAADRTARLRPGELQQKLPRQGLPAMAGSAIIDQQTAALRRRLGAITAADATSIVRANEAVKDAVFAVGDKAQEIVKIIQQLSNGDFWEAAKTALREVFGLGGGTGTPGETKR